jgi:hypothetical protein
MLFDLKLAIFWHMQKTTGPRPGNTVVKRKFLIKGCLAISTCRDHLAISACRDRLAHSGPNASA